VRSSLSCVKVAIVAAASLDACPINAFPAGRGRHCQSVLPSPFGPLTPCLWCATGLAIKDYWNVDADTVVFVADPSLGNIINFNGALKSRRHLADAPGVCVSEAAVNSWPLRVEGLQCDVRAANDRIPLLRGARGVSVSVG
jgi:hypothetical protein